MSRDSEAHVALKVASGEIRTWADGFGVWHAEVRDTYVFPMGVAKMAIRLELQERAPRDTTMRMPKVVRCDVCQADAKPEHTVYKEDVR